MVMAVSFERYGRLYYLDPGEFSPRVGDKVLIPTDDGTEVAECVWAPAMSDDDIGGLPKLAGLAAADDLERDNRNRKRKAEAKVAAKRLIRQHDLPMKVVGVDYLDRGDPRRIVVYFSAPHRVDFRDLVRDMSRTLDVKVELRQLAARDEARVQGGIGPCGRDLCCATFLKDFEPVTVRMAKDQDLPVNPLKISGACGRLLCCLKYEHPLYQEFKADAPKLGSTVETPEGEGRVIGHNVPSDSVVVRLAASGQTCRCSKASVCAPRRSYDDAVASGARPDADGEPSSDA
jgi:cell fate regulator YaaT (PSP1 superfamily)